MINITVNGKKETINTISLSEYLNSKNINKNTVVVEINGNIIQKTDVEKTEFKENDKVEIVRFIGGG
jgi:sulfur carrier protein